MNLAANLATTFVALSHLGFLALEMFFWNHPVGWKIFALTPEVAASSAVLAMNQGLYNGFLAAGLVWGVIAGRRDVKLFFLGCVIVAGVFGAVTAKPTILFTQALPGAIALLLVLLATRGKDAGIAQPARTQ
jgi:putative membrane protein